MSRFLWFTVYISAIKDVFHATLLAKLTYCSPAWCCYCSAADRVRLDAFLPTELLSDAHGTFLARMLHNRNHVLQSHLQEHFVPAYSISSGLTTH